MVKNKPVIVSRNVGTVDYETGEIFLDTIIIDSTVRSNNIIEIESIPDSNDVIGLSDLYIRFVLKRNNIDIVPDLIESGANASGTRFISSSSYIDSNELQYIRK